MKTAWVCFWIAFAAAEVGLTCWFRSVTFLEIGLLAPLMVIFNLQRVRAGARSLAQGPVEVVQTTPVAG
jgi:hypothetical protein